MKTADDKKKQYIYFLHQECGFIFFYEAPMIRFHFFSFSPWNAPQDDKFMGEKRKKKILEKYHLESLEMMLIITKPAHTVAC